MVSPKKPRGVLKFIVLLFPDFVFGTRHMRSGSKPGQTTPGASFVGNYGVAYIFLKVVW